MTNREQPPDEQQHGTPTERARPGRRPVVVAAVALLAVTATLIVLTRGSAPETAAAAPAPDDCVKAWNEGEEARTYTRHNRTFHSYEGARVARIAAGTVSEEAAGPCVVVFGSDALDPEPEYAGQVLREGRWQSLIEELDPSRVDELQSEAVSRSNVELAEDGRLLPTSD